MSRVAVGAVAVLTLSAGCVQAREVTTPSGKSGQLVQCDDTSDCYEKARDVCQGDYRIVDSASRSVGRWGSFKEITVECGSADDSAPPADTSPGAPVARAAELDQAAAPTSAAGFTFGDGIDAVSALCTNAGHGWEGSGERYTCTGTPVDTGLDAQARLTFCASTLCRIEVVSPPPSDSAALSRRFEKVLALLTERYGDPTRRDVLFPPFCRGGALGECLEKNNARFLYKWSWKGGKAVVLSLGPRKQAQSFTERQRDANPATLKTLRIRYEEGRTPDTSRSAAAAAGEPEVSGL